MCKLMIIPKTVSFIFIFSMFILVNSLHAEETKFSETIAVLQAHAKYAVFAKKAVEEGYPNIGYLFWLFRVLSG